MFEDELETAYAHFWVFMHTPACEASAASACGKTPSGADIIAYGGFWDMAGDGNITNVTVAEEYRGRGYGKVVVHFLLGEMARMNMESASLEVRASNAAATRLYEACGFTHVGCRKSYYSDGEAALLFAREVEYGRSPLCKEKGEGAPATPEVLRGSDRE
jgi:ribosomal protein S18 acetylase RimI-like enzyme